MDKKYYIKLNIISKLLKKMAIQMNVEVQLNHISNSGFKTEALLMFYSELRIITLF